MVRRLNVLLEWDPEGRVWVSYVPDLNHLSTYGETRDEAIANTREAIIGYLEASAKEGLELPPLGTDAELVAVEVATA